MELSKFLRLVKAKKQTIISLVILFFLASLIFTLVQPFKYNSKSSVLVVQNLPRVIDPYTLSKSNEYLSNILAKVVSSNLFYNDVINSGYNINKDYFSKKNNINEAMKKWQSAVQAKAISDTGIIDINIYHPDKQQLDQLAQAVNYVLQSKHGQYHGLGSNIALKVINKPLTSAWPAKPNIILNLALAVLLGLIISLYYVYLFPEPIYDFNFWSKLNLRKVKKIKFFHDDFAKAAVSEINIADNEIINNDKITKSIVNIETNERIEENTAREEDGQEKSYLRGSMANLI